MSGFKSTTVFVVQDTFRIKGRGTVVVARPLLREIRIGDRLEFWSDDKALFRTRIVGVEVFLGSPLPKKGDPIPVGILVEDSEDIRSQIAVGQEVRLIDEHDP